MDVREKKGREKKYLSRTQKGRRVKVPLARTIEAKVEFTPNNISPKRVLFTRKSL